MVSPTRVAFLPHSKTKLSSTHTRGIRGLGFGSVLLTGKNGGAGSASSYASLDDYINTTNMNPYTQQKTGGMGLGGISKRLQQLNVKPTKKSRNISFTL
jgi:hypothetical protein